MCVYIIFIITRFYAAAAYNSLGVRTLAGRVVAQTASEVMASDTERKARRQKLQGGADVLVAEAWSCTQTTPVSCSGPAQPSPGSEINSAGTSNSGTNGVRSIADVD